jgi:hypothetical protein
VKTDVAEDLPMSDGKIELQAGCFGASQFTLPISRASSDRTYPGGLPRFDRTSSQPLAELTTLILVPPLICEITGEADDGLSYTDVGRMVS